MQQSVDVDAIQSFDARGFENVQFSARSSHIYFSFPDRKASLLSRVAGAIICSEPCVIMP
jgi:hypothetical protein